MEGGRALLRTGMPPVLAWLSRCRLAGGLREQPQAGRSSSITSAISHCSVGQGPSFPPHSHFTQEHTGPAQEPRGQESTGLPTMTAHPFPHSRRMQGVSCSHGE